MTKEIMMKVTELMGELASMKELAKEAAATIDGIEDELKAIMMENGVDELLSVDGKKCTYRENIMKRFDSTAFKKVHGDLYEAFRKETKYKRFTFTA